MAHTNIGLRIPLSSKTPQAVFDFLYDLVLRRDRGDTDNPKDILMHKFFGRPDWYGLLDNKIGKILALDGEQAFLTLHTTAYSTKTLTLFQEWIEPFVSTQHEYTYLGFSADSDSLIPDIWVSSTKDKKVMRVPVELSPELQDKNIVGFSRIEVALDLEIGKRLDLVYFSEQKRTVLLPGETSAPSEGIREAVVKLELPGLVIP